MRGDGRFIGDLCSPCHEMITTGNVKYGTTFFHDILDKYALVERYPSATTTNLVNFFKVLETYWVKDPLPPAFEAIDPAWETEDVFDESYGCYCRRVYILTQGRLDNEMLIESMRKNKLLWQKTWEVSNKQGLHVFSFHLEDH